MHASKLTRSKFEFDNPIEDEELFDSLLWCLPCHRPVVAKHNQITVDRGRIKKWEL